MTGLVTDGGKAGQVLTKKTDNYAGQPEIDYDWENSDKNIRIAGTTPDEVGVVYVVPKLGIGINPGGGLNLAPTTNSQIGGIVDAPWDGKVYGRINNDWTEVSPAVYQWGIGITSDTDANGVTTVTLEPAGTIQDQLGGVYVIPGIGGISVGSDGGLTGVPATPDQLGMFVDSPWDSKVYARSNGNWTEVSPAVYQWGIGVTSDTDANGVTTVTLEPAGNKPEQLGGVYVVPKLGIGINPGGGLNLAPATDSQIGGIVDAPWDGKDYSRNNGGWIEATSQIVPGIGLEWNATDPDTLDLQQATLGGEIGGVRCTARNERQGLVLDYNGYITAPVATSVHAGSIVEPPGDDKAYMRMRSSAGISVWVPPVSSASSFVAQFDWTPTGQEPVSTTPQFTFTVPVADLPNVAFDYIVGNPGNFFVHNNGNGAQAVTGNGGAWTIALEYPAGSGTFVDVASFAFDQTSFPDATGRVIRCGPVDDSDIVFHFDPAVDPGITFNVRFTGGDNTGNPWNVTIGMEGRILGQPSTTGVGLPEAPIDAQVYGRKNAAWQPVVFSATIGDVKSSFLTTDHSGWIILDGRLISTLSATQQDEAMKLGFNTNLPDAESAVMIMRGGTGNVLGAITGENSRPITIALANLPVHNLSLTALDIAPYDFASATTSGWDPGAISTSSNGAHGHESEAHTGGATAGFEHPDMAWNKWHTGAQIMNEGTAYTAKRTLVKDAGDHNHTVDLPNHTHTLDLGSHDHTIGGTLPLGGSGTAITYDHTPKHMHVNMFCFLGS